MFTGNMGPHNVRCKIMFMQKCLFPNTNIKCIHKSCHQIATPRNYKKKTDYISKMLR